MARKAREPHPLVSFMGALAIVTFFVLTIVIIGYSIDIANHKKQNAPEYCALIQNHDPCVDSCGCGWCATRCMSPSLANDCVAALDTASKTCDARLAGLENGFRTTGFVMAGCIGFIIFICLASCLVQELISWGRIETLPPPPSSSV